MFKEQTYSWAEDLGQCMQDEGESATQFSIRLSVIANKSGIKGKELDKICCAAYRNQCLPSLRKMLENMSVRADFAELIEQGLAFEKRAASRGKCAKRAREVMMYKPDWLPSNGREYDDDEMMRIEEEMKEESIAKRQYVDRNQRYGGGQQQRNQFIYRNQNDRSGQNGSDTRGICFCCAKSGHSFEECRSASEDDKKRVSRQIRDGSLDQVDLKVRNKEWRKKRAEWRRRGKRQTNSLNSEQTPSAPSANKI